MKSYYLLALALFHSGGGAMRSALEALADARELYFCSEEDADELSALETNIFQIHGKQMDLEKSLGSALPQVQSLMNLRYTRIPRHLYPWDTYSQIGTDMRIVDNINQGLQNKSPSVKVSSTTESGQALWLKLHAREGVIESQDLFTEQSTLQVFSTDCTFFTYEGLMCDGCGTGMLVPPSLLENLEGLEAEERPGDDRHVSDAIPETEAVSTSSRSAFVSVSRARSDQTISSPTPPNERSQRTREPTPPSPSPSPSRSPSPMKSDLRQFKSLLQKLPEGFSLCPVCKEAAFCSPNCLQECILNHHVFICSRGIEQWIRDSVLPYQVEGLPDPHAQRITLLLLLRLFATLIKCAGSHPLEHPWVQLLNVNCKEAPSMRHSYEQVALHRCFPDLYDTSNRPRLLCAEERERMTKDLRPWSFETNVRKPFNMLMYIGGPKMAFDVSRFDGWILNTMITKIEHNAMTTFGARFEKGFDTSGMLVSEECLALVQQVDDATLAQKGKLEMKDDYDPDLWRERQVWTGSLYPLSSLVRIAREGEEANVVLYERAGTIVCRPVIRHQQQRKDSAADLDSDHDGGIFSPWTLPIKPGDELVRERNIRPLKLKSDYGYEAFEAHETLMARSEATSETEAACSSDVEMIG